MSARRSSSSVAGRLGRVGEPFERRAQARVVVLRGVDAHEQAVRLHLLGVAREHFLKQFGELLPPARPASAGSTTQSSSARGGVGVALPQVEPRHVEEEREARRVAADELVGAALGALGVLGLDVGAREHGADFEVAGPLLDGLLQSSRGLVGRAERGVDGEQPVERGVRGGPERERAREGVERALELLARGEARRRPRCRPRRRGRAGLRAT